VTKGDGIIIIIIIIIITITTVVEFSPCFYSWN